MNRRLVLGVGVLLLAGAGWWWWHSKSAASARNAGAGSSAWTPVAAGSGAAPVGIADPAAYSELNDARQPPLNDLKIVAGLLRNYVESVKSAAAPPLGFNEDIVRALAGNNPLGVAFLPAKHPSINSAGQWCDRWGTPYLFHPLSAAAMEVRSAGPDRRLFTDDDLVLSPPSNPPAAD